ncbi:sensory box sensor histidine kinase/response regulator VieS [Shewanella sp. MBTL60-007]|nr:sensory box sensor histidine kinase/response regulator VieS [Shewanella sp. MBTL60-007]
MTCQDAHGLDSLHDSSTLAYVQQKKVLKVGVHTITRFPYWGGNAELPSGLLHDLAKLTGEELNLAIEYIQFDTLASLLEALDANEIDASYGFIKSPSRLSRFSFSGPIFSVNRIILLKKSKMQLEHSQLTWACIAGTMYCEYLKQLGYNYVSFNNGNEFNESLFRDDVDAIFSSYDSTLWILENLDIDDSQLKIDYSLGSVPTYIILSNKQTKLKAVLDRLVAHWNESGTLDRLLSKYWINTNLQKFRLGENDKFEVKFTVAGDVFPYFYRDKSNEGHSGFIQDVLDKISARTPITFKYVPVRGRNVESMLASGLVDVLPLYNAESYDSNFFTATRQYAQADYLYVRSLAEQPLDNIGVLDRVGIFHAFNMVTEYIAYDELQNILADLETGQLSHAYINRHLLESLLLSGDVDDILELVPSPSSKSFSTSIAMLINKSDQSTLDVMNKALNTISAREYLNIGRTYDRIDYSIGYDRQELFRYVVLLIVVICLITVFTIKYFKRLKSILDSHYASMVLSQFKVEWLHSVLDTIPHMICIRDNSNQLLFANKQYYNESRLAGYDDILDLADTLLSFIDQDLRIPFVRVIEVDQASHRLAGRIFQVIHCAINHGSDDVAAFFMTSFFDITHEQRKERQLILSEQNAMGLAKQKSDFVAIVSHELRTPISTMLGFMEMIQNNPNRADKHNILDNAIISANRLKELVDDILDYSKMEANQLSMNKEWVVLVTEICPTIRPFEALAINKGVRFWFDWKPTEYVYALIDSVRINQVISNVLSNAVKFTSNGWISISIINNHNQLTIRIKDSGIGMSEAQLAKLFQPFVQAEPNTSKHYGGTGLGMSIVANLIELMKGKIHVHSTLGVGTNIKIDIPIETKPSTVNNTEGNRELLDEAEVTWWQILGHKESKSDSINPGREIVYPDQIYFSLNEIEQTLTTNDSSTSSSLSAHVLIVDDDPMNRLLLSKQLADLGLSVTQATDGSQALNIIKSDAKIDCVITDCHMPKVNGFEFVEQLITYYTEADRIPVIGCTADNSLTNTEKAMAVGMDTLIYKPYTISELSSVLHSILADGNTKWVLELPNETDYGKEYANALVKSIKVILEELQHDHFDLIAIVHRVKGSASIIEHAYLRRLCEQIELNTNKAELVKELIITLEEVLHQAQKALKEYR